MPSAQDPVEHIRELSFRQANRKYHISYEKWHEIKQGKPSTWKPYRGGGRSPLDVQDIMDSVRQKPALSTGARARWLGRRTEAVQRVLKEKGLNRLNARLKYAGYSVDVTRSLQRARQHRVLAGGPGVYTNVDFKRLGSVRRVEAGDRQETSRLVCGVQCVDAYSGFASCFLTDREDAAAAVAGLKRYLDTAPYKVSGLVLSDNGLPFLSDDFIVFLKTHNFIHRTTRYHHPWSNGKVESFNKTLKYQCMPALVAAGITDIQKAQGWLDKWLDWYNTKRAHSGWINRGLPPRAVIKNWQATPGDVLTRLLTLGHIKKDEVHRTRLMGSGLHAVDMGLKPESSPYAFIIEAPPVALKPDLPSGWTLAK